MYTGFLVLHDFGKIPYALRHCGVPMLQMYQQPPNRITLLFPYKASKAKQVAQLQLKGNTRKGNCALNSP
jgi:hypothetical protein